MTLKEISDKELSLGQVANPVRGDFNGQCVSQVIYTMYYLIGLPDRAYGNAKDWATNRLLPEYFDRLAGNTPVKPGDVIVYNSSWGKGYGHVAVIDWDGQILEQNYTPLKMSKRPFTYTSAISAVLRPKKAFEVGTPAPAPQNNDGATCWYKVTKSCGAAVRSAPSTKAPKAGSQFLKQGATFEGYVNMVNGDYVSGNPRWLKSKKGNYLWSGGIERI